MASGQGFALFESRFGTKMAAKPGFDPSSILIWIQAIATLVQGCTKPTPAAMRRKLFNRAALALTAKKLDSSLSFSDAFEGADHCFDVAKEATDPEAQLFLDDCMGA